MSNGTRTSSTRRRHLMAVAVVAGLLAVTGCGGAAEHGASSASYSEPKVDGGATRDSASAPQVKRAAVRDRAVIRTGEIAVTAKHLSTVRAQVDDLVGRLGGSVDREDTTTAKDGSIERSTLVLRVPVDDFDTAKRALGRLGRLKSSTESGEDVTTEVIDTAERVQTLQNSLDRLQRFQRTSKDVADLIRYEDQITTRQSELQSLKARQDYLSSQTSMSTLTLHLSTPETYVAPAGALDDAGFLAGLAGGWRALGGVVVVTLTVLGALLPFAVAFVLVGVPLWLTVRGLVRRRRVVTES